MHKIERSLDEHEYLYSVYALVFSFCSPMWLCRVPR